ncbi:hypothetical protein ANO11243_006590 [Dothideomycetidae sp. 11243]|nr:hypothetical protein ANO11243_006590 [fungal sp. No.11243]
MECVVCAMRSLRLHPSRQFLGPLSAFTHTQRRTVSTARRLRSKHRIWPAPSFTPSPEEKQDHIIYNPPSSLPNIYHTPPRFLPASDPRRLATAAPATTQLSTPAPAPPQSALQSLAFSRLAASSSSSSSQPTQLAPLSRPHERKYHLSEADVAEMRRLRSADHREWTVKKLALRFDCAEAFVRLAAPSPAAKEEQDAKILGVKSRWGRSKREAREDRSRRKELWGVGL